MAAPKQNVKTFEAQLTERKEKNGPECVLLTLYNSTEQIFAQEKERNTLPLIKETNICFNEFLTTVLVSNSNSKVL